MKASKDLADSVHEKAKSSDKDERAVATAVIDLETDYLRCRRTSKDSSYLKFAANFLQLQVLDIAR